MYQIPPLVTRICFVILIFLSIQACTPHDFDLGKISLPISKAAITKQFPLEDEQFNVANGARFSTSDQKALYFEGQSLDGSVSGMENKLVFYVDKNSNQAQAYSLNIRTKSETEKLEQALFNKFGKPDYYYKHKDMNFRIWESGSMTYFLEVNYTVKYSGVSTVTADLNVVTNTYTPLYTYFMGGPYAYFADYIAERKKLNNPKYTYKEFARQRVADGSPYYGRELVP